MAIDLIGSARATALVTLVIASFSSPMIVKSDAAANLADRLPGRDAGQHATAPPKEDLVVGGVQFELPASWGRLGASAAAAGQARADGGGRIANIVSGVCPGGSTGGGCKGEAKLTFLAFSGKEGHALPQLAALEGTLDDQLGSRYRGFHKRAASMRPGADGMRYLDYSFSWRDGAATRMQRLVAYRHDDGAGVITLVNGSSSAMHAASIDTFLASAHEPAASD